ncbi:hypothetical protein [Amycolatopsis methanolica]|uniref:Uncharacterized protein n=1 Tax=Amycolatopsis methanolica 239 TaxID=1068978 RepID=A0A076MJ26_AMYME|nr:hypothetical protein [Amycolatopsis methanolica]AIJ20868.1 hypothetical protein AMETH_0776 [Amycolatopsis methanolica 239]
MDDEYFRDLRHWLALPRKVVESLDPVEDEQMLLPIPVPRRPVD